MKKGNGRARGANWTGFAGLEPEAMQAERAEVWEERLCWRWRTPRRLILAKLPVKKSHPDKVRLAATP